MKRQPQLARLSHVALHWASVSGSFRDHSPTPGPAPSCTYFALGSGLAYVPGLLQSADVRFVLYAVLLPKPALHAQTRLLVAEPGDACCADEASQVRQLL